MRTFKIVIILLILFSFGAVALYGISTLLPSSEPSASDFNETYEEGHTSEAEEAYDLEIHKKTGIVRPLGVSIYKQGTHRLEKDNKLQVLLESSVFELSTYEGEEVEVQGIVADTVEGNQKIMDVTNIIKVSSSISGRTYFDDLSYDYYLQFPSAWSYEKEVGRVDFHLKEDTEKMPLISILQYDNREESLQEWLEEKQLEIATIDSQVVVAGEVGVRRSYLEQGTEVMKTYIKHNTSIYEMRYVGTDETVKRQYLSVLDSFSFERQEQEEPEEEESKEDDEKEPEEPEAAVTEESIPELTEPEQESESVSVTDELEYLSDEDLSPDQNQLTNEESEPEFSETESTEPSNQSPVSNGTTLHTLQALSQTQIQNGIAKGYGNFEGRSLIFDYPNEWIFTWLGGGEYGFTDYNTYTEYEEVITRDISRLLVLVGQTDIQCTYKKQSTKEGTLYTVCARESGLEEIVDYMVTTIQKP